MQSVHRKKYYMIEDQIYYELNVGLQSNVKKWNYVAEIGRQKSDVWMPTKKNHFRCIWPSYDTFDRWLLFFFHYYNLTCPLSGIQFWWSRSGNIITPFRFTKWIIFRARLFMRKIEMIFLFFLDKWILFKSVWFVLLL